MEVAKSSACILLKINHFAGHILPRTGLNLTALGLTPIDQTPIDEKINGYLYILEVKDIVLPVCKIGMTTRNPFERCKELNNSSTGDFIWEVAHYIAVDNWKLESLVHSKLAPLRQKRREFFNIGAVDAIKALNSIFDAQ